MQQKQISLSKDLKEGEVSIRTNIITGAVEIFVNPNNLGVTARIENELPYNSIIINFSKELDSYCVLGREIQKRCC